MRGVRLAQPTIGETFVVIGLGLIGQLTTQILIANGCKVIGFDLNPKRVKLSQKFGVKAFNLNDIDDPVEVAMSCSGDKGVDGVLITAFTKSSEPIYQAAQMCRKRGRIILVGVTGLKLTRADFYEKELIFQVLCSCGPGRYDESYENKGNDYPFGFVRWTAKRNFDISVFPSILESESFGVAAVETQACGIPVVVSNVGGLPEVVRNGKTGIVVPPRDINGLKNAIIDLMLNIEKRKRYSINSREHVLHNYNWKENAKIMEDLYLEFN